MIRARKMHYIGESMEVRKRLRHHRNAFLGKGRAELLDCLEELLRCSGAHISELRFRLHLRPRRSKAQLRAAETKLIAKYRRAHRGVVNRVRDTRQPFGGMTLQARSRAAHKRNATLGPQGLSLAAMRAQQTLRGSRGIAKSSRY